MTDWNKIVKSNVVKTFRNICHNWWGIDIQFYDANGNSRNNNIPLNNPLCYLFNSKTKGATCCHQYCKKHLKGLNKSKGPSIFKCHSGLNVVAIPIFVSGDYVGAMLGSGIRSSKTKTPWTKRDMLKLTKIGLDKTKVEQCYNKLNLLNAHSEAYLVDFMEQIVGDIVSFSEVLRKKDEETKKLTAQLEATYNEKYNEIIGASMIMRKVFSTLDMIENCESPVLIEGETGTGKELLASAIHHNSRRRGKVFIDLNCSMFSRSLLSSELYGHVRGAFTGAVSEKKGILEIADGGTLFLDEIGDMDLEVQASLLRVLENGTYYNVGGTKQKKVDIRIITATNKELKKQIEKGLFRKDLLYRINTMHVCLPALRERKEDIPLLTNHFLSTHTKGYDTNQKSISLAVIKQLIAYHWPGNVRELENMIKRMIILSGSDETIITEHVPTEITTMLTLDTSEVKLNKGQKLRNALRDVEKEMILDELKSTDWNKEFVIKKLGIGRTTLYDKIAQYKILK